MNAPLAYTVRILYRFTGTTNEHTETIRLTARDEREAKSQARMVWIDKIPKGHGVEFRGCTAEPDVGQLELL